MTAQPQSSADGVSVLIAAYNAAPFLSRAVASALTQSAPPVEVLIVDDASTDATARVAGALAEQDGRVRVLRLGVNRGPAAARNAGGAAARGAWIAVLDADDAFLPGRLAALTTIARTHDADVVADNFLWRPAHDDLPADAGLAPTSTIETVDAATFAARARPYRGEADWGLLKPMFRTQFLRDNGLAYPAHVRHGEDFHMMLDLLLAGGRYVVSRSPGYIYTPREAGLSRTSIDYDAMARLTRDLIAEPRVSADRRLVAALRLRLQAVRRLAAESKATALAQERRYGRIAFECLRDAEVLRFTAELAAAYARRRLGGRAASQVAPPAASVSAAD
jgi:succinoglycan biosynthesis protein ExoO